MRLGKIITVGDIQLGLWEFTQKLFESLVPSLFWSVVPPLLVLGYYWLRVRMRPSTSRLLLCFLLGAVSGVAALGFAWSVEAGLRQAIAWDEITRTLPGIALRQLVEVGPIEEGCKLGAVWLIVQRYGFRRRLPQVTPSEVLLYTTAVALGFAAEENLVYLVNQVASVLDRAIGSGVHAWFSAPWGYAVALWVCRSMRLYSPRYRVSILLALGNAIACHAWVNILSSAWRYDPPIQWLSYGLFPFLLWMAWRMEWLLQRSQGQIPQPLISGRNKHHRLWQRGLLLFALLLGGNAIFGLFLLARSLSSLSLVQILSTPSLLTFALSRSVLSLGFGLVAFGIYRYLKRRSDREYRPRHYR